MFALTQPMDRSEIGSTRPTPSRACARAGQTADTGAAASGSLSPSLLLDLQRFDRVSPTRELLEVLAAGLRHTQALAIDLRWGPSALTLSLFPRARTVHCTLPMPDLLTGDLSALRVLRVRPAWLRPAADMAPSSAAALARYAPLDPLLWLIALRGARSALLPELAGQAAYRLAPGLDLSGLEVPALMASCLGRLRRQTCNLSDIAAWQAIGVERANRLLNALYLQSGLIVSRSHPAATNAGWTGYD
jgi:hypothetical protein